MLRSSKPRSTKQRRAAILLITIVLLMLFLVIGMCFLAFAEAQATSSRIYREASLYLADRYPTPQEMFGWGLGEIIYDVPDGPDNIQFDGSYSAIRGHGLARNMYGWNYQNVAGTSNNVGVNNETPFNGIGRPHTSGAQAMNPFGADDFQLINYQYFNGDPAAINFKRNPERDRNGLYTGGFNAPYTYPDLNNVYLAAVNANGQVLIPSFWRGNHTGFGPLDPTNPNWFDPASSPLAKYLTPRPRPIDQLTAAELAVATPASVQAMAVGGQIFPLPASPTGDVQNLPWGGGVPDSVWVDLGYPVVRLAATNRKIKPMFAFLIVDLDGKVNLNVAGNVKESSLNNYHGSIHGFGPWEINPRRLMETTNNPFPLPNQFGPFGSDVEYQDLFRGNAAAGGRFGKRPGVPNNYPPFPASPPAIPNFPVPNAFNQTASVPGNAPKYYAQADWDASSVKTPPGSGTRQTPAFPVTGGYSAFPIFPQHYQNGNLEERYYHPSLFNPFRLNRSPTFPPLTPDQLDRILPVSDMQKLMAWITPGPTPSAANPFGMSPDIINSEIGKLWPTNVLRYPRMLRMITTHSMDLDRPGAAPGQPINVGPGFAQTPSPYMLNPAAPVLPQTYATRIPAAAGGGAVWYSATTPATSLLPNRPAIPAPGGDLRANDWRSALADLGRVDVNRSLAPYYDANDPAQPAPVPGSRFNMAVNAVKNQVDKADRDRRLLANDIFDRLRFSTGAADPTLFAASDPGALPPTDPNRQQFEALRYLAQLAANIVDFVDDDDVNTSFNFLGGVQPWGWVFGTEMPRIVLNEVYAQIQNHPGDQFSTMMNYAPGATFDPDTPSAAMGRPYTGVPGTAKATMPYRVNFFVELHNPHQADQNLTPYELPANAGAARLQLTDPGIPAGQPKGVYKLIIRSQVDADATRDPKNVTGDPVTAAAPAIDVQVLDFTSDGPAAAAGVQELVKPSAGAYGLRTANDKLNNGYFVLGPSTQYMDSMMMQKPNWQSNFPYDRDPTKGYPAPFTPTVSVKDQQFNGVNSQLYAELPTTFDLTTLAANQPSVFLQRLANPMLPPQPNPAQPYYNPYITVDYLHMPPPAPSTANWLNDAVLYDTVGARNAAGNQRQPLNGGGNNRISIGRRQPFRATGISKQTVATADPSTLDNTFFTQNGDTTTNATGGNSAGTLDGQFEWLVHFDRRLANVMDLLYVSGFKPHELTQQFIPGETAINTLAWGSPTERHQHLAPWRDPNTRLYRAMEMLGTNGYMFGSVFGGRVPGKININTIWDPEVFRALSDSYNVTPANYFTAAQADAIWTPLMTGRSPGLALPTPAITPNDQPFWSLATPNPGSKDDQNQIDPSGMTPGYLQSGIQKTILGRDFKGTLVPTATPHPYATEDLLRKIFANVTTRSNTFAVFITTSFFVVRDDSTQPVKLGGEVDPQLRHRMFAIVDRTNLSMDPNNPRLQGGRPIFMPFEPITPGPLNNPGNPSVAANLQSMMPAGSPVIETTVPAYSATGVGPLGTMVVRDTIDHNGREYSATSGEAFTLIRGQVVYLDVGANMEPAQVLEVHPSTLTVKLVRLGGGPFLKPHHRGCSICTQRLGNPGPQKLPLDYDAPPYSNTVVPFRMILQ